LPSKVLVGKGALENDIAGVIRRFAQGKYIRSSYMTVQDQGAWAFLKMYRNKYCCHFLRLDTDYSMMNLNRLKSGCTQATKIFDEQYTFNPVSK
jgi:hypothetical protein